MQADRRVPRCPQLDKITIVLHPKKYEGSEKEKADQVENRRQTHIANATRLTEEIPLLSEECLQAGGLKNLALRRVARTRRAEEHARTWLHEQARERLEAQTAMRTLEQLLNDARERFESARVKVREAVESVRQARTAFAGAEERHRADKGESGLFGSIFAREDAELRAARAEVAEAEHAAAAATSEESDALAHVQSLEEQMRTADQEARAASKRALKLAPSMFAALLIARAKKQTCTRLELSMEASRAVAEQDANSEEGRLRNLEKHLKKKRKELDDANSQVAECVQALVAWQQRMEQLMADAEAVHLKFKVTDTKAKLLKNEIARETARIEDALQKEKDEVGRDAEKRAASEQKSTMKRMKEIRERIDKKDDLRRKYPRESIMGKGCICAYGEACVCGVNKRMPEGRLNELLVKEERYTKEELQEMPLGRKQQEILEVRKEGKQDEKGSGSHAASAEEVQQRLLDATAENDFSKLCDDLAARLDQLRSRKSATLYVCGCCSGPVHAPLPSETEVASYVVETHPSSIRTMVKYQRPSVLQLAVDLQREACLSAMLSLGEPLAVSAPTNELRAGFADVLEAAFARALHAPSDESADTCAALLHALPNRPLVRWVMGWFSPSQLDAAWAQAIKLQRATGHVDGEPAVPCDGDALMSALDESLGLRVAAFGAQLRHPGWCETVRRLVGTPMLASPAQFEHVAHAAAELSPHDSPLLLALAAWRCLPMAGESSAITVLIDALSDVASNDPDACRPMPRGAADGFTALSLAAAVGATHAAERLAQAGMSSELPSLLARSTPVELALINQHTQTAVSLQPGRSSNWTGSYSPRDAARIASALIGHVNSPSAATSLLPVIVQLLEEGAPALHAQAAQHLLRNVTQAATCFLQRHHQTPPSIGDHWRRLFQTLTQRGGELWPTKSSKVAPLEYLLAHSAWDLWPAIAQQTLHARLTAAAVASSEAHVLGLHALALAPSERSIEVARLLLAAGASANSTYAEGEHAQRTPLHLLALSTTDETASVAELTHIFLEHGANWRAKDERGDMPIHLAAAGDNVNVAEQLLAAGSAFERPWINRAGKSPFDLAPEGSAVHLMLTSERKAKARRRKEAESRRLHSLAHSTIDTLMDGSLTITELMGASEARQPLGQIDQSVSRPPLSQSSKVESDRFTPLGPLPVIPEAPSKPTAWLPGAQALLERMRFGSHRVKLVVTRFVLRQLQLLDERRTISALSVFSDLVGGDSASVAVVKESLEVVRDRPLYCSHVSVGGSRQHVYVVWECDWEGTPFYEAASLQDCGGIVRVWSVEPTDENIGHVIDYVVECWELGSGACEWESGQPYPMGTTAPTDAAPGDSWHPTNAEETGELHVPSIVKWHIMSDAVAQLLLKPKTNALPFQLPMLLDEKESGIAALGGPSPACSTVLVGRSGTGKTSICMQMLFDAHAANLDRLRPAASVANDENALGARREPVCVVFLCKSRTLHTNVSKQFEDLVRPLQPEGLAASRSQLLRAFVSGEPLAAPLFLSSAEWLVLLDRALPTRFFASDAESDAFVAAQSGEADSLAWLQEASAGPSAAVRRSAQGEAAARGKSTPKRQLLTFEIFVDLLRGFEPSHRIIKDLSAANVFREFYSYIKGSAEALDCPTGTLSRQAYLDLPVKQTAVLPAQRPAIYDLFEAFRRKLRTQLEKKKIYYDLQDLVLHLKKQLTALGDAPRPFTAVHRMVCDEVQDLTQAELSLLLLAISDKNGLFACGDSAQTISKGVGFRFKDVNSLFHGIPGAAQPQLTQLTRNYRTHQGIVECASTIVTVMSTHWPQHVDSSRTGTPCDEPHAAFACRHWAWMRSGASLRLSCCQPHR